MAIEAFSRTDNFFSGFENIRSDGIDTQFNMVSDYLNTEVLPALTTLIDSKIPGSTNPADTNKFLQNVGDLTTQWAYISSDDFTDNSLKLSKLIKTNSGSIIAVNSSNNWQATFSTTANTALVSRDNDLPRWQKLDSSNLEDRTINGDSVADETITNVNLPARLIETLITDDSITGDKFQDSSITSIKVEDDTINAEQLTPSLLDEFPNTVWENIIPDSYLATTNSIINNTDPNLNFGTRRASFARMFSTVGAPVLYSMTPVIGTTNIVVNTTFPIDKFKPFMPPVVNGTMESATKLKSNDIVADRVMIRAVANPNSTTTPPFLFAWCRDLSTMIANQSIGLEHLTPALRDRLERARG